MFIKIRGYIPVTQSVKAGDAKAALRLFHEKFPTAVVTEVGGVEFDGLCSKCREALVFIGEGNINEPKPLCVACGGKYPGELPQMIVSMSTSD